LSLTWSELGAEFGAALKDGWHTWCAENGYSPNDPDVFPMWLQHISIITNLRPGYPITLSCSIAARDKSKSSEYHYAISRVDGQPRMFRV
jgi:hypothetical protein